MNMDKILDEAIEKDASDVHLICGNKPILRIRRKLLPIEEMDVLTPDDMNEMYDYLKDMLSDEEHGEIARTLYEPFFTAYEGGIRHE